MALELKYLCQRIEHEIDGETFALKPQGAQDIRRYDVLKDVGRMEQFLAARPIGRSPHAGQRPVLLVRTEARRHM